MTKKTISDIRFPATLFSPNSSEGIGKQSFLYNVKDHKLYISNAVIFATATKDLSQKLFSKEQKFILLIEDDIHFIHAPRKPTSSVTSTSWHMCTVLADIHCNIHAVPQNDDFKLNHRSARVVMPDGAIRECRGGIDMLNCPNKSIFQISRTAFGISGTLNKAL